MTGTLQCSDGPLLTVVWDGWDGRLTFNPGRRRHVRHATTGLSARLLGWAGVCRVWQHGAVSTSSRTAAKGQRAPDFTLDDQEGKAFHLAERTGAGPVVLVFLRGFG